MRKISLILIILLILTLSIIGLTYAFMRPQVKKKEEKSNITINACAKIQLKDNGSFINLENSYPMDDEKGLETKPYEFTIISTCEDYIGFNLYLTSLTTNEIEDNNIHFAITSKENTVLVTNILNKTNNGLNDFNSEELQELDKGIKGTHKNIYKVYSNNIPLKGESSYKLYLWLDKDASNETMGKSFKVGLSIKSYNREATYADTCDESLATCEIAQKVYENNTLIYHDASVKNGANDLSYRYSGGDNEEFNNIKNFVCLDGSTTKDNCETDDDLYRIIGLFKNDEGNYEMKLIKADGSTSNQLGIIGAYAGKYSVVYAQFKSYYKGTNWENLARYSWNSSLGFYENNGNINMWKESNLNKVNLNDFYYNYLITRAPYLENHISNHMWEVGGTSNEINAKAVYDSELGPNKLKPSAHNCYTTIDSSRECNEENDLTYRDEIGLMYVSDYMYATLPIYWETTASNYKNLNVTNNNWMYMGLYEVTISRLSISSNIVRRVGVSGSIFDTFTVHYINAVRPCFYLNFDTKLKEGNGSKEKPYRLTFE